MRDDAAYFTLIQNGEVYAPEPLGVQSVLLAGEQLVKLGPVDLAALRALGLPWQVVDAAGCLVLPGLVDPHAHLIGAGGEQGVGSRMPEVPLDDLLRAGVTTVVGCLGTDTVTRQLPALLAKVRQLDVGGITAYMYTGGFPVPPPTLTGSVAGDLVLIDKVIGVGEVAIADVRSSQPSLGGLARLVSQAYVGGTLSDKAGVTHFHVGPGRDRLAQLHALLDEHEVLARQLYPTHVNRSAALMDEAIALAARGAYVDVDTVDGGVGRWLHYYRAHGGALDRLTVSSDAHTPGGSPGQYYANLVASVHEYGLPLAEVLPSFTRNVAQALRLPTKGELREGMDGDVVVVARETLTVVHVFARGREMVRQEQVV